MSRKSKRGKRSNKRSRSSKRRPQRPARLWQQVMGSTAMECCDSPDGMMYMAAHELLPPDAHRWSGKRLWELVQIALEGQQESWLRALIVLAHNASPLAGELLQELGRNSPPELQGVWQQGWAEHQSWVELTAQGRGIDRDSLIVSIVPQWGMVGGN